VCTITNFTVFLLTSVRKQEGGGGEEDVDVTYVILEKIAMASIEDLTKRVEALELEVKELKEEEKWKPIEGLWDYQISSKGRIVKYNGFVPKIGLERRGYYRVKLAGKLYKLHRLLAETFIPNPEGKPFVDHIDGDKLNNSLSNLRWCTHAENQRNRGKPVNNTSGFKGVYFNKVHGKYYARIRVNGKLKHLGCFRTPEEAAAVYEKAAKELHGEFFCKR